MKSQTDRLGVLAAIVGVVALLVVSSAVAFAIMGSQPPKAPLAGPTAGASVTAQTSTSVPTPESSATPPPETPDFSATQTQEFIATMVADQANVAATLTAHPPLVTAAPEATGIIEDDYVRFSGKNLGLNTINGWAGYVNGDPAGIWAGSLLSDPDQGAVVLLLTLPYRNFEETYLTSGKHGALRIVAEQNNRLILTAADSTTFYFDVPARQFANSIDEVLPTAIPPATYTPYAPPTPSSPAPTGYPLEPTQASTASP